MLRLEYENIVVRKFEEKDIENKIKWINDRKNNTYLHYDLPLEYEKTLAWYKKAKDVSSRFDGVIEYEGTPVGLIGLLGIDEKNLKAEYYVCIGEHTFKGCGIAKKASKALLSYAFDTLNLRKIYLYTEEENLAAQKLFERLGFRQEGLLKSDLIYCGRIVNRYAYGLLKEEHKR